MKHPKTLPINPNAPLPVGLHAVVRPRSARPCRCRPAGQNPYGYIVFKWTLIAGGRWKTVCITENIHEAVEQANKKKIKTVLIKCRNCGDEALREWPNAELRHGERE